MTLLYVDDDPDDLDLLYTILMDIDPDIRYIPFQKGKEAMNFLELATDLPDMIFMDINMPIMNGKQCLTEIRKSNRLRHLPVIMYTTSSEEREIKECYKLGATDFLIKPSNIQEFHSGLVAVLNNQKNERLKFNSPIV
ncbi:response regulator [Pseudochryseolinea flava]|uniref:Response regulator n=1 Tax=Pseudochryseolinea flava TaxID=2059302 RepID=A0A364XXI6_9BACT|nr:response regulator [Pseudochryseolinea flava]RAV99168.1 response regulator [Pseudochryseolinea flava]